MEENFKIFRKHLSNDKVEDSEEHLFSSIKSKYQENKIDFYDFIDKMHSYNKILYKFSSHLKNTNIEKIEITDNNILFTTREEGIKLVFNGKDRRGIPFEMINWGAYEKQEIEIFNRLLKDKMTILDIGSNIGWYSLLWGKKFPNAKIHAFEPIEETFKYLVTNVTMNGLNNIILHNFGLSDKNEETHFHYYPSGAALASIKNVLHYEGAQQTACTVKTLDSMAKDLNMKEIDFIKCDVEGAELQVVLGAETSIKTYLPIIVLELFHEWSTSFDYHPNEAINFLKQHGYRAFLPLNGQLEEVENYIENDFDRQNYFFLHKEKHKESIEELKNPIKK